MKPIWRRWANPEIPTEPLISGVNATRRNISMLDEIDKLGLSRERSLRIDEHGDLQKVEGWSKCALTETEINELEKESLFFTAGR